MSSNSIYTSQICFVYKWTQLSTGKWYIGSHTSKSAHPNDGYLCSSKIAKPLIQENRDDWIRVILDTGSDKDMLQLEHELLTCLNAAKSEYSYNRSNGGKFSNVGNVYSNESKMKMSKSQLNRAPISVETRLKQSKANAGRIVSIDTRAKLSAIRKGKPKSDATKAKIAAAQVVRWGLK